MAPATMAWRSWALQLAVACLVTDIDALAASRASFDARRVKQFEASVKSLVLGFDGILMIDGDNVRGKSLFGLSHSSLLARTARWSAKNELSGNVVLLVDHGTLPSSYHLPGMGVSIAFSGPKLSADDVAARDVPWFHARGHDVMLVTADSGLAMRCRRAGTGRSLTIVPPQALLAALQYSPPVITPASVAASAAASAVASETPSAVALAASGVEIGEAQLAALEQEMQARAALTRAERAVHRVGESGERGSNAALSLSRTRTRSLSRSVSLSRSLALAMRQELRCACLGCP